MSFDPQLPEEADERNQRRDERRVRRDDDEFEPARRRWDDDDDARRRPSARADAASYALPPAIVMIVCAILNVPAVLFCAWTLIFHLSMNVDDFVANQQQAKQVMQNMGFNNDRLLQNPAASLLQIRLTYGFLTGLYSISTLLVFLGGIQMMRLRGYALSLIGAFALTIPCGTSCCVIGQVVGIWALVVLFSATVREQFR